jgi:hypothetical protein
MAMIEERLAEGQQMTDDGSTPSVDNVQNLSHFQD